MRMESSYLFPAIPQLHFYPENEHCHCTKPSTILKKNNKKTATLDIGEFMAIETQTACKHCKVVFRSEQLRKLTPRRGKYGFDVIEHIGKALFLNCRNESDIQAELSSKNISISNSEIGFLGKRFIIYLLLAHIECQAELKQYMQLKGGSILHMDGTCEGDSPHLFSCMDELSRIVSGNSKMPSEDSQQIIPLLEDMKAAYGTPAALVHDMGAAILKAVAAVFPDVADFICHFHFLRDLGKDLFELECRAIHRITRSYNIRAKLNKTAKQLKTVIDDDKQLSDSLKAYLKNKQKVQACPDKLDSVLTAYLIVTWILEAGRAGNGFGFPFDLPHLEFYLRLQESHLSLERLKAKGVSGLPSVTLNKLLKDVSLGIMVSQIKEKISIFETLRIAMRVACPGKKNGLNDESDEDMNTIKQRVKKFRYSSKLEALASLDTAYRKMIKQIDKYWDKLFADPIKVETPAGIIIVQPQRTNNMMEQSFRFLKRDGRKKSGQHSLSKTLKGMLADTLLVRNLSNPDYMTILLKGKKDLATRFADIDIQQVLEKEKENAKKLRKYPKGMDKVFKIPHLPQKLMEQVL